MASFSKKTSDGRTRTRTVTFRVVGNITKMTALHSALGAMQRIADAVRETAQPILETTENAAETIHLLGKEIYAQVRLTEPEMCSKPTQTLVQRTLPSKSHKDITKFLRAQTSRGVMYLDNQVLDIKETDNRWTYWIRIPVSVAVPEGKKARRVRFLNYALAGEYPTEQLQRPEVISINQVAIYRRLRKDCLCIFASVTFTERVPVLEPAEKAGIDINMERLVCSDGKHFRFDGYHHSKRQLKSRMKKPNGPQNEAKLKSKDSNFAKDYVRKLSAKIVSHLKKNNVSDLALEDLIGLTSSIKKGWSEKQKARNLAYSQFPFAVFRAALASACQKVGIRVHIINPAYTSQTCSACGHVCKDNRTTQSRFACVKCGHVANADVNAAINIRKRIDSIGLRPLMSESVKPDAAQLEQDVSMLQLEKFHYPKRSGCFI